MFNPGHEVSTKVFPQGSSVSSLEELTEEEPNKNSVATTQPSDVCACRFPRKARAPLRVAEEATNSEDAGQAGMNNTAEVTNTTDFVGETSPTNILDDNYQLLNLDDRLERLQSMGIDCKVCQRGSLLVVTVNGIPIGKDSFMQRSLDSFVRSKEISSEQLKARASIEQMKLRNKKLSKFYT